MIDARIQQDIKRLTQERPAIAPLAGAIAPAQITDKTSLGNRAATVADSGIASPLTEVPNSRAYHSNQTLTSTNGLFVFTVKPISELHLADAAGRAILLNLEA